MALDWLKLNGGEAVKIKDIVENLCNHSLSKDQAIEEITNIVNGFRKGKAIEFVVDEVGFTVERNDGYLKLKIPFRYDKIERKIKAGDKVDVIILP